MFFNQFRKQKKDLKELDLVQVHIILLVFFLSFIHRSHLGKRKNLFCSPFLKRRKMKLMMKYIQPIHGFLNPFETSSHQLILTFGFMMPRRSAELKERFVHTTYSFYFLFVCMCYKNTSVLCCNIFFSQETQTWNSIFGVGRKVISPKRMEKTLFQKESF